MTEMQTHNSILDAWNALDTSTAAETILPCNGSRTWADQLAALRPFDSPFDLTCTADIIWRALPASDWQQAFDSHPRIGERHAKAATLQSLQWSNSEQSAAQLTQQSTDTEAALVVANLAYEEKFGRIFIVCASGKRATEILAILNARLDNTAAAELLEAAEQQRQITQLRLRRWLGVS
jgi:2-oxo-4-hydroxy-4-carboxy-5-ureidoimidazoline decarboxylase